MAAMEIVPAAPALLLCEEKADGQGHTMIMNMDSRGMVNATKMCQGFGKLIADYRKTSATQSYLEALSGYMNQVIDDLWSYDRTATNENRATWVHQAVAVDIAGWLSPQFKAWMSILVQRYLAGQVTTQESKAAQAAMEGSRRSKRAAALALEEANNSLVQYLERGDGGYEYDPDSKVLDFKSFWNWYRNWCYAEGLQVCHPKSKGKSVAKEFVLKEAAEKLGWSVMVKGFPQTIVGMDLASQIDKPWREYGRHTLKSFFVSMMGPDEESSIPVPVLKREYTAFCFANKCSEEPWNECVITRAIEEFEDKNQGAKIEPRNERGKMIDGSRCYTGFDLARRLR